MTDRVVFAQDLDATRALTEDGSKAYVKVDGTTIDYDASGNLTSIATAAVVQAVTTGHEIGSVDGVSLYETITTLAKDPATHSITYTNEAGVTVTVSGADFLSAAAGNSLIINADGGLYFAATAMINDDQILTGDNTGSIMFTLTPTTVPDPLNPNQNQVNYTIKGVVQLAPTTPSGQPNAATLDANSKLVVDPAAAQAGLTAAVNKVTPAIDIKSASGATLTSIPLTKVTNLSGSVARGWVDLT